MLRTGTSLLRSARHLALAVEGGLSTVWYQIQEASTSGQHDLHNSLLSSASPYSAASGWRWPSAARGFASDSKDAALQRLARASRHRAQRAVAERADKTAQQDVAAAPGTDAVVVKPSEAQASPAQVSDVVSHPALIITRPIEWGTVIFGYEQANRYQVFDQDGQPVAMIAEDFGGLGNEVGRQLLRTRRGFTATVFSADGSQVIFRVKRPPYLITSSMTIEDAEGNQVGEVHRRWSLLQRNYDLYLNKKQFAAIAGNFLAWEFELKDSNGGTLAFIDRNFQGFGKEIFTDAGKYVIHFGMPADKAAEVVSRTQSQTQTPPVTSVAVARTNVSVIPTATGNQLAVARPLELSERMITLACAISIDYDFFSQHSHGSGVMGGMPILMPMPMPGVPGSSEPGPGATPEAGAAAPGGLGSGVGAAGAAAPGSLDPTAPQAGAPNPPPESAAGDGWSEPQFGQNEQEIKWDDGVGGSEGGDGGGEGIIGTIWGWVSGGD